MAVQESFWLNDWSMLEKYQVLPVEGGILDQGSKFVEACAIINQVRQAATERVESGKT